MKTRQYLSLALCLLLLCGSASNIFAFFGFGNPFPKKYVKYLSTQEKKDYTYYTRKLKGGKKRHRSDAKKRLKALKKKVSLRLKRKKRSGRKKKRGFSFSRRKKKGSKGRKGSTRKGFSKITAKVTKLEGQLAKANVFVFRQAAPDFDGISTKQQKRASKAVDSIIKGAAKLLSSIKKTKGLTRVERKKLSTRVSAVSSKAYSALPYIISAGVALQKKLHRKLEATVEDGSTATLESAFKLVSKVASHHTKGSKKLLSVGKKAGKAGVSNQARNSARKLYKKLSGRGLSRLADTAVKAAQELETKGTLKVDKVLEKEARENENYIEATQALLEEDVDPDDTKAVKKMMKARKKAQKNLRKQRKDLEKLSQKTIEKTIKVIKAPNLGKRYGTRLHRAMRQREKAEEHEALQKAAALLADLTPVDKNLEQGISDPTSSFGDDGAGAGAGEGEEPEYGMDGAEETEDSGSMADDHSSLSGYDEEPSLMHDDEESEDRTEEDESHADDHSSLDDDAEMDHMHDEEASPAQSSSRGWGSVRSSLKAKRAFSSSRHDDEEHSASGDDSTSSEHIESKLGPYPMHGEADHDAHMDDVEAY